MEGVIPDRTRRSHQDVGAHVLFVYQARSGRLADALGARASAAEVARGERARVSVGPADREALSALLPDLDRSSPVARETGHLFLHDREGDVPEGLDADLLCDPTCNLAECGP